MRATNQNWWLDWYLYCILEDVFGMMRNSTWLVFFKYSSPLTTSSCFSSFSPSIKVSLVPIHIYPPFFHTSCIFLYLPSAHPWLHPQHLTQPSHHPSIFQAEGSGLPSPQLPMPSERRLDDWGRGIPSKISESMDVCIQRNHTTKSQSFVVFVVSKIWPKCSPTPPCDIPFVWRNEVFRTQFLWRHLHGRQLKAECLWFGSCRGESGDSASGWNMVKQHQMGG